MDQLNFSDLNDRVEQITRIGAPFEALNKIVDLCRFDGILLKAKAKDLQEHKSFSLRLILKVFILQNLYNFSEDLMKRQIKDRLSFMRFLGLGSAGLRPTPR